MVSTDSTAPTRAETALTEQRVIPHQECVLRDVVLDTREFTVMKVSVVWIDLLYTLTHTYYEILLGLKCLYVFEFVWCVGLHIYIKLDSQV